MKSQKAIAQEYQRHLKRAEDHHNKIGKVVYSHLAERDERETAAVYRNMLHDLTDAQITALLAKPALLPTPKPGTQPDISRAGSAH